MMVVRCLVLLLAVVGCMAINMEDIDCGWATITPDECVAKGCYWLPGFNGPWCHTPDSPYIPTALDRFGLSGLYEEQKTILNFTLISFVTLSVFAFIGTRSSSSSSSLNISLTMIIVGVLLALAWVTRYYKIEHPGEVAFDEYYFGQFANSYCNRIYVFDIHPALAKLTHYFFGSLLGVKCTMDFHKTGGFEKYTDVDEYVPYRLVSAFFGTVAVPLAYLIGRKFKLSVSSSLLLATLVFCDPLLLSETRLILTDSQLFFYIILSIYCALNLWDSKDGTLSRFFWIIATAVASGCAFSVKFTALATLGWIAFGTYLCVFTSQAPVKLKHCFFAAIIAFIVFCIPFYVHIQLSQKSGESDWNIDPEYQRLLIGHQLYDENAVAPFFPIHLVYLVKRMLEQNAASLGDHPYASYWYEWVVGRGSLLAYAEHKDDLDWHGHIFIVASIHICYAILIGFVSFFPIAFTIIRNRVSRKLSDREIHFLKVGFMLFLGWIANLFPYAMVARTTYSYHYLPGQFFGMIMVCLLLDFVPYLFLSNRYKGDQLERLAKKLSTLLIIIAMGFTFWGYFRYSIFAYGFGVSKSQYDLLKWAVGGV
mmetsp:Transcript_37548/g.64467  ORF Transcript_37548/g.64467 Transcript_37548/m.64467 type:complete len:593 (-) Transcript_37548:61-1839(-)